MRAPVPTPLARARRWGLSLVEVLVAIAILGVISAAVVAVLPSLTRTTVAANEDVEVTQRVLSVFEVLQSEWQLTTAPVWASNEDPSVRAQELLDAAVGGRCSATHTMLSVVVDGSDVDWGVELTVTCPASGALPERVLLRAYGDPR